MTPDQQTQWIANFRYWPISAITDGVLVLIQATAYRP
jgi:hypothetical protein